MTRASQGGGELTDLVRRHGAALHRLAAILTADTQAATGLTARALAAVEPDEEIDVDRLRRHVVRGYLRAAPRRAEELRSSDGDAGDVLRHLRPRARAASVLRLVEGWDTDRTAAAVGVARRRVETLVPAVPGLDLVLTGLADQHSLAGAELEGALLRAAPGEQASRDGRPRRRRWLIAAVLSLVLVGGYLLSEDRTDRDNDLGETTAVATAGQVDLTEAGWRLDDKGAPPWAVSGLRLQETVVLDDGRRSVTVSLPRPPSFSFATFGVLWCDMPPAQDDHLAVPNGTLTVDGDRIALPCAGRDGAPPVTQVVALPPGGEGVLEVSGDLPGDGGATLAVYAEADSAVVPAPLDGQAEPPPGDGGALVFDVSDPRSSTSLGHRTVRSVSVGQESTLRVWAGRTGSIEVRVDGIPVTDDGDLTAMLALLAAWEEELRHDDQAPLPEPRDHVHWSSQQADVRDGRWLVPVPDMTRTFQLPEQVLPPPGERRTVSVEVLTENVEDRLQVVLTEARPVEVDTAPVAALAAPEAPRHALGHRLVGQWTVPADGHLRELELNGPAALPDETVVLLVHEAGPATWFSPGEGVVNRGGEDRRVWVHGGLEAALGQLPYSEFARLPAGTGPLTVAAPAAQDHPPTAVLAYVPVPYEQFDFAGAAVPPDSWPAGSDPPVQPYASSHREGYEAVAVLGPEDVEDGQVSLTVPPGRELAVQVTTEGKGRMKFQFDGWSPDGPQLPDGWWSSWTDQEVTSLVPMFSSPRAEVELTVLVEDYENFTIEVLTR